MIVNPRYPVYIVSKNRWERCITARALQDMNVPFYIVVEESQRQLYEDANLGGTVIVLPQSYLDEYDTFDDLGFTKGKGPGAARNFAWDHSISLGFTHHWVLDDNIDAFHYLNRNQKLEVKSGVIFKAAEDFVARYSNVPLAGLNYYSFCKSTDAVPPFTINTRIYSCLFIQNDIPFRWRGRYNEDTDLSLRILKAGYCTIQFNAFLQGKVTTQRMKGGNTEEFYANEGTLPKSQMLEDMHPDVAKVVWKFNRWHHHVDYSRFKSENKLKKIVDVSGLPKVNNYGLKLIGGKIKTETKDRPEDFIDIDDEMVIC